MDLPLLAKKHSKTKPPAGASIDADESRAAVALTVAWMLTTMSCIAAQGVAGLMWLIARGARIPAGRPNTLDVVSGVLLMVGVLTGIVAISLAALVLRIRRSRPPAAITIGSVLIGIIPLVTIVVLMFL